MDGYLDSRKPAAPCICISLSQPSVMILLRHRLNQWDAGRAAMRLDPVLDDHHFLPNGGSRNPEIMPNDNSARSLLAAVGWSQTRFVSGVLEGSWW